MIQTKFNFKSKSGPSVLITGGILFILLGVFAKIDGLTLLGILMIIGGGALSYHWSQIIGGRRR